MMTDLKPELLFPEDTLLFYVRDLLIDTSLGIKITGVRSVQPDHCVFGALSENGVVIELITPVCEYETGVIRFRSLLRKIDKKPVWMSDGQADKGCLEVVFWGEDAPMLIASKTSLKGYLASGDRMSKSAPSAHVVRMGNELSRLIETGIYEDDFKIEHVGVAHLHGANETPFLQI